jgi:hypothetical protein
VPTATHAPASCVPNARSDEAASKNFGIGRKGSFKKTTAKRSAGRKAESEAADSSVGRSLSPPVSPPETVHESKTGDGDGDGDGDGVAVDGLLDTFFESEMAVAVQSMESEPRNAVAAEENTRRQKGKRNNCVVQ